MRALVTALALVLVAGPLAAQGIPLPSTPEYRTGGLAIGFGFLGSSLSSEDSDEIDSGGGIGIRIGYGFTENLSVFLQGTAASMTVSGYSSQSYILSQGEIGLRYLFTPGRRFVPYGEFSLGGRQFEYDTGTPWGDAQARGSAVSLGGGGEVFVGTSLALDLGLDLSYGRFTHGRLGNDRWESFGSDAFAATSARLNIGLVWRP